MRDCDRVRPRGQRRSYQPILTPLELVVFELSYCLLRSLGGEEEREEEEEEGGGTLVRRDGSSVSLVSSMPADESTREDGAQE